MKSSKPDIIALIEEGTSGISAYHKQVESYGSINAFIVQVDEEERLENNWEKLRNRIAVYFQSNLESDFERWNLYLIFACPEPIPKILKYKIENDRISSRKIVVDNFKEEINDEAISSIIKKYINYSFLLPDENKESHGIYTSNSVIYRLISEKEVSSFTIRNKELKNLHSKIKDELS